MTNKKNDSNADSDLNVVEGHAVSPICFSRRNVKKFVHACYTQGVPRKSVVDALKNSENIYNDWWLGERLQNQGSIKQSPRLSFKDQIEAASYSENDKLCKFEKVSIETIKSCLLLALKDGTRKPEENPQFILAWNHLHSYYSSSQENSNQADSLSMLDNIWLTMNPPSYKDCLGENKNGNKMYTLGRMSFDMFRPTDLICSIQWVFNIISSTERKNQVPESIRSEGNIESFRVYNICTAFTVEPTESDGNESDKPLQGLMTTFGFLLPDPSFKNRFTIWFTGGMIEEANSREIGPSNKWKRTFSDPKGRTLTQKISVLAASVILGAQISDKMDEKDGSIEYTFKKPIGGHGRCYVDVSSFHLRFFLELSK